MEHKGWNKIAKDYTQKASEIVRNLMLAGIGVVWILKGNRPFSELDNNLVWSLIWLVIALSLDFLHYFIGGILWKWFFRVNEKRYKTK